MEKSERAPASDTASRWGGGMLALLGMWVDPVDRKVGRPGSTHDRPTLVRPDRTFAANWSGSMIVHHGSDWILTPKSSPGGASVVSACLRGSKTH